MSNKPPIRLKFRDSEGITAPVTSAPVVAAPKHVPKPPKPPPPSIGTEKIVVKCGHTIAFDLYAKDPFREGRRQKETSRDCPACRQARVAADVAAAAVRKAKKTAEKMAKIRPRLPDGSRFAAVYDAGTTQWTGTLTIEGVVFEQRASGLKKLLDRLDDAYREPMPTPPIAVEGPDQPSAA
jgi:hypothetical protein